MQTNIRRDVTIYWCVWPNRSSTSSNNSFQILWPCIFISEVTASHYSVIESNSMFLKLIFLLAAPCCKSQICMWFMHHESLVLSMQIWQMEKGPHRDIFNSQLTPIQKERKACVDKAAAAFTPLPWISSLYNWLPKLWHLAPETCCLLLGKGKKQIRLQYGFIRQ